MFTMPALALNVFAESSLSVLAMGTEAHPPATKATTTMQNPAIFLNIDRPLCLKSIVSCCDLIFDEEARVCQEQPSTNRFYRYSPCFASQSWMRPATCRLFLSIIAIY